MLITDICIIGGGPSGSTLASRLAAFRHRVCLVERATFPRAHLGESLSPGVLPLLEVIGAREAVESAGFYRVGVVRVHWADDLQWRRDSGQQGMLVDRGRFDSLLLNHAKDRGVQVLQPAIVRERHWDGHAWHLRIHENGRVIDVRTKFLADASGRAAALPSDKRRAGHSTLCLYAYWRGSRLPAEPHIEAGADAWYWGVPLPDGSYNTLVFVDTQQFRSAQRVPLASRFQELIARSRLMEGCQDTHLATHVLAADATPYVDTNCVTSCSIKVGDAALALDPLSSSGVQKAIQNALAGATVVNTILRKPESTAAAIRFFQDRVASASESHRHWAAAHYSQVAKSRGEKFWNDRALGALPALPSELSPRPLVESVPAQTPLQLSPRIEFIDQPCIEGKFVTTKTAVRHPNLDGPIAFVGEWEIAPLLKRLHAPLTPAQAARLWSNQVPIDSSAALISWLIRRGILVHVLP